MYSFFWDCIDIYEEFNELQELKTLPITETKKNMIAKSLDSSIMFLKERIDNTALKDIFIKPKDVYALYCKYILESPHLKKLMMNSDSFLEKMKDLKDVIKFHYKKRIAPENATTYVYIDRAILINFFTEKHYFNEYDSA
jgi:hypothetical protein